MSQVIEVENVGKVEFPDELSEDQIKPLLDQQFGPRSKQAEEAKTSPAGAFGIGAASGIAPTAVGVAAGEAVAPWAVAAAPETLGLSLLAIPAAGLGGGWLAGRAQQKAIHKFAPKVEEYQQAAEAEHPGWTTAGGVTSALPSLRITGPQVFTAGSLLRRTLAGGLVGAAQPLAEGRAPTGYDIAGGAASFGLYGGGARFRLPGSLARMAAAAKAKSILPQAAAEVEEGVRQDAIQERGTTEVPLGQTPEDREAVGEGVSAPEKAAEAKAPEEGQARVLQLSPEDQASLDAERKALHIPEADIAYEVGKPSAGDDAFANRDVARADQETGRIVIDPEALAESLRRLNPEERQPWLRQILAHEQNHLAVSRADAEKYAGTLSAFELAMERRIYLGKGQWRGELSDAKLGWEAIRRRMTRLAGMTTDEVLGAAKNERWKLRSLEVLNDTVRNIRETLGTKASKEGLAILDRVQKNLDAGIKALGGTVQPGAQMAAAEPGGKKPEVTEDNLDEIARNEPKKLTHSAGIEYGLTLDESEVPRLEGQYNAAQQNMVAAFGKGSEAEQMEAFGKSNFYGGALQGVTRGKHSAAGGNYELWLKHQKPGDKVPGREKGKEGERDPKDIAKEVGGVRYDGVQDFTSVGGKRFWQWTLTTPGRQTTFYTESNATPSAVSRQAAIKNLQYDEGIGEEREAARIYDERQAALAPAAKVPRREKGTPEFSMPDVPRGTAVERGVHIEVPEEARRLKVTTPSDIDWSQRSQEGSYRPISAEEARNPEQLGKIITTDAGIGGTNLPKSSSRRLLGAIKKNGQVDMLSTYRDGRRGPVVFDPDKGKSVPLEDILSKYKPLYSVLRDSPVRHFHQHFDSMDDFQNRFGEEAQQRYQESLGEQAAATPFGTKAAAVRSSSEWEYKGGGKQALAEMPAVRQEGMPSSADLKAFHDFFEGETPPSKEAFDRAIGRASGTATHQMAKAVNQAFLQEKERNPNVADEVNVESALAKLYDDLQKSDTRSGFIESATARYRQGLAETLQKRGLPAQALGAPQRGIPEPGPQQVSPTARELTMRQRLAPTAIRGQQLPTGPGPTPALPAPEATARLTPEAQGHVAAQAQRGFIQRAIEQPATTGRGAPKFSLPQRNLLGPRMWEKPGARMPSPRAAVERGLDDSLGKIRAFIARGEQKQQLSSMVDSANTKAVTMSETEKSAIEQPTSSRAHKHGDPATLGASFAINAAYDPNYHPKRGQAGAAYPSVGLIKNPRFPPPAWFANPAKLPELLRSVRNGMQKAQQLIATPTRAALDAVGLKDITGVSNRQIKRIGQDWLRAAQDLEKEVRNAIDHFDEPGLMETTVRFRDAQTRQLGWEHNNGKDTAEAPNYAQGLYEGELYGDNSVTFQSIILGKSFAKPKTFPNRYVAVENGPFIPKAKSVADSAAHRIRSGAQSVLRDQAFQATLGMTDKFSGAPIGIEAQASKEGGYQVPGGNQQYRLVYPQGGGKPIAVRRGYAKLVDDLFGRSGIEDWVGGRALMQAGALEKHTTLAGDIYHLNKMAAYAMAISRWKTGYRGALAAMQFRPENLGEAVRRGVIRQADMDWALKQHTVMLDGQVQSLNRQEILREFAQTGANIGRIQDAMYRHFVDALDVTIGGKKIGIGGYNRFLFNEWTRGLMGNSLVDEFVRQTKAARSIDGRIIMRRIARDVNTEFGSAGKQGIVKNPTLRDINQLIWLAAQWTGSRISTEAKFLSRLATTPYIAATQGMAAANVHFGTIGRGVGTGMLAMLAATQAANLISRGTFTWQNPEEDHKLDAWIPDVQGGPGHWVSPMSVYMEITHDVARYRAARKGKEDLGSVITQIAENKLQPIARAGLTLASGYTPMGQKITGGLPSRLGQAGKALIPVPITVSAGLRGAGHALAPSLVSANAPGALQRQAMASMAVKTETERGPIAQVNDLARAFMKREGLEKETGWQQVQTDEPGYSKLRSAIRAGDDKAAKRNLDALRRTRTDTEIMRQMQTWAKHGFTGSRKNEGKFWQSLNERELELYDKAQEQKQLQYEKWLDWFYRQD